MEKSKYSKILAIATAVCAIILGILFIIFCSHLYFTGGEQPYSRTRVGEYLILLALPSLVTLALAICGIVYNAVTGESDEENAKRTSSDLLEGFVKRYDFESFDKKTKSLVNAERKTRKILNIVVYSVSALLFILAFVYIVFVSEYSVENLNGDVLSAFAIALPLSAIGIALHVPRIYLSEKSCKTELDLLKASVKNHGAPALAKTTEEAKAIDYVSVAKYAIVFVAIVFVIIGIFNGGMSDVLAKAVKICTECIGLG